MRAVIRSTAIAILYSLLIAVWLWLYWPIRYEIGIRFSWIDPLMLVVYGGLHILFGFALGLLSSVRYREAACAIAYSSMMILLIRNIVNDLGWRLFLEDLWISIVFCLCIVLISILGMWLSRKVVSRLRPSA